MHEFTYQINGQPLDPTAYIEWPDRMANECPDMQQVKVPVVSVQECGPVVFRHLQACADTYTPVLQSTTPVCEAPACSGLDSFIKDNGEITVEGDTTLYFDLGRVIKGTFELEANFPVGVKLTMGIGEAKEPLRTYTVGPKPDGSFQKFKPKIGETQGMRYTGLQHVWLRIEGLTQSAVIRSANGMLRVYPCAYLGDFKCSDDLLNKIWEMCAYSVKLAMESYWPKIAHNSPDDKPHGVTPALIFDRLDRFPWAGDSRIMIEGVMYAFGEFEFAKDHLEFFIPKAVNDCQNSDWPPMAAVCLFDLPPYVLDWILGVLNYVDLTGDKKELEHRIPLIIKTLEQWGTSHVPFGFYFFDWDPRIMHNRSPLVTEPIMTEAYPAFIHKYIEAAHEAMRLCELFGLEAEAGKCREIFEERKDSWVNLYPDWASRFDIHAITNAILGGIGTAEDFETAFERVYADKDYRCTGTPYFGYHVLRALACLGKHTEALEMIRLYWGKMIEFGATTVWEEFEHTWELEFGQQPPQPYGHGCNSLCQPAGIGPLMWLMREILGVRPLEPGFQKLRIQPHFSDLEWAKGVVPTLRGNICVEWKRQDDGKINMAFDIPHGIEETEIVLDNLSQAVLNSKVVQTIKQSDGKQVIKVKQTGKNILEIEI